MQWRDGHKSGEWYLGMTPEEPAVPGPFPSTVYVLWPWPEAPLQEEILAALGNSATLSEEQEVSVDDALWTAVFSVRGHPASMLVWAAAADDFSAAARMGGGSWEDGEAEKVKEAHWLLTVQTLLNPHDPMTSYHLQLKFCNQLCADSPGVFDACSFRLRPGRVVRRMADRNVPPPPEELFTVQAILPDDQSVAWLHTHGLNRAGLPEMEILGVPGTLCAGAGCLINTLADQLLGSEVPAEETPFDIGPGLRIAWVEWAKAVRGLPRGTLGGPADRGDGSEDDPHAGYRRVLIDPQRTTSKKYEPPIGVIERFARSDLIHFHSHLESDRQAARAQETWTDFARRHKAHAADGWRFFVKLRFDTDRPGLDGPAQEHLWFRVKRIDIDRVQAVLDSAPEWILAMKQGQEDWHSLERLTGWRIDTPAGTITSENPDEGFGS